jgi:transcription elongation GreA/GreB family factor
MANTQQKHEELKNLVAQKRWNDVQSLWLDIADEHDDNPEFLLLLVKEISQAGQDILAAELAGLLAPSLEQAGKVHEWLFALKIQAAANAKNKDLRAQVLAAYAKLHESDPRWKSILAASELSQPNAPLPAAIARADTLLALRENTYCSHKSWGFGRIKSFDAALGRIVIGFTHNPDHTMQLPYAAESLIPVNDDHIEVRKITDLASLQKLAATDPLAILRQLLISHNRSLLPDKIESVLAGSVVPADQWKKWWDTARKLLKKDPHFIFPARKTEPVILRSAPVSQQDDLLESFRNRAGLAKKTAVARQLLKTIGDMADPDLLIQEFQDGLLAEIRKLAPETSTLRTERHAECIEAACAIEELGRNRQVNTEPAGSLLSDLLARAKDLPATLDELSAAAQKLSIAILKANRAAQIAGDLNRFSARVLDDITDILAGSADRITQLIRNQTASSDLLLWVIKNKPLAEPNPDLAWLKNIGGAQIIAASISALEANNGQSLKRLYDQFMSDDALLTDLLVDAHVDTVRDVARQVLGSTVFPELDRRSLMARLVKTFPFVQEFLVSGATQEQPLIVSWASYHKRKAELDDIVTKKIPANSREIGVARSYGDLRENFEYKAAKDMQKLLMRRRAELEILLSRAQPSDFNDIKTDAVGIATSVTVLDLGKNEPVTYHILGAWDSDPNRNIISYPAALAQALFGKKPGDVVEWKGETGTVRYRIERIENVPAEILQSL